MQFSHNQPIECEHTICKHIIESGQKVDVLESCTMNIKISYDRHDKSWDVDSGKPLDGIRLESAEIEVNLDRVGNLYLVSAYSEYVTTFRVTDNKDEAVQSFKEELAYLVYESPGVDDENEELTAERVLKENGFLDDMRNAYSILEDHDGKVRVRRKVDNYDELSDRIRDEYPDFNAPLIRLALSALDHKKHIRLDLEDDGIYYSVIRKLDF